MKRTNTYMEKRFFTALITLAAVITFVGCATADVAASGGAAIAGADGQRYTEKSIPTGNKTLAAALAWIRSNAVQWGAYTITVKADETIAAQYLGFDDKRVRITLKGDAPGREVRLSGTDSLFAVGRGVTLQVENLTLKGRGNRESEANDHALVRVDAEGTLILKAGALITENYNAEGGGGVNLNENAVFVMEGGEIRDNTAKRGGGVYTSGSFFTMQGGTISGNTVEEEEGGLNVRRSTFTLSGGTISNNTAGQADGGVCVSDATTFTMTGEAISGNHAAHIRTRLSVQRLWTSVGEYAQPKRQVLQGTSRHIPACVHRKYRQLCALPRLLDIEPFVFHSCIFSSSVSCVISISDPFSSRIRI